MTSTNSTLQIKASGSDTWVTVNEYADNDLAFTEASRIYRESARTLDVRLVESGVVIVEFTNTLEVA